MKCSFIDICFIIIFQKKSNFPVTAHDLNSIKNTLQYGFLVCSLQIPQHKGQKCQLVSLPKIAKLIDRQGLFSPSAKNTLRNLASVR